MLHPRSFRRSDRIRAKLLQRDVLLLAWLVVVTVTTTTVDAFTPVLPQRPSFASFESGLSSSTLPDVNENTRQSKAASSSTSTATVVDCDIIPPSGYFRDTQDGEFSIVSYNALAPFYHALRLPEEERANALQCDRRDRVPLSLDVAKQCCADILCLQEVEQEGLAAHLSRPFSLNDETIERTIPGYDMCLWTPMNPKRVDVDPVGVAMAWRSDKFTCVSKDMFRRGMVLSLQETNNPEHIIHIANVHLPARPSAIEARLRFTAATVRRLQQAQASHGRGGSAIICGDLNCETKAPNLRYLERGSVSYGTLRDRNYKMRLGKKAAAGLTHNLRFRHAYDTPNSNNSEATKQACAVTVSLHGRGPGSMDHIYYTPNVVKQRKIVSSLPYASSGRSSKRASRRNRFSVSTPSSSGRTYSMHQPSLQVAAVLSTIDDMNMPERTRIINEGLPNESAGFHSDHLPIGALFVPAARSKNASSGFGNSSSKSRSRNSAASAINGDENSGRFRRQTTTSGLSTAAQQRRATFRESRQRRWRHNAVLNAVVDLFPWEPPVLSNTPLYKWPYALPGVKQKKRAPDYCGILSTLDNQVDDNKREVVVVLEVTVVSNDKLEQAYRAKAEKYEDVIEALRKSIVLDDDYEKMVISDALLVVVAVDERGQLAPQSRAELLQLMNLLNWRESLAELDGLAQVISSIVREYHDDWPHSP